jgi:hypothetical protein
LYQKSTEKSNILLIIGIEQDMAISVDPISRLLKTDFSSQGTRQTPQPHHHKIYDLHLFHDYGHFLHFINPLGSSFALVLSSTVKSWKTFCQSGIRRGS